VFGILWVLRKRFQREGVLVLVYLLLYSAVRFGVESFRGDRSMVGMLSVAQWTALATALISILLMVWGRFRFITVTGSPMDKPHRPLPFIQRNN